MTQPTCSVVVRCKNEAAGIGAALRSVREQSVDTQVVVVDSGSTDGTVDIARRLCDELVEIPPASFSFGRALNVGAASSAGEVIVALSAHCVLPTPTWVEHALEHYADPGVAGTCWRRETGASAGGFGARPVTFDDVAADPHVGLSNHASSWRRRTWEDLPFDEELASCEDKEWMWRAMRSGWRIVADPRLFVDSGHRRAAGMRSLWKRELAEHQAIASHLDRPVGGAGDLLVEWWSSFPYPSARPRWQRRLSPKRTTELVAGYLGDRAGARRRGSHTVRLPPTGVPQRPGDTGATDGRPAPMQRVSPTP